MFLTKEQKMQRLKEKMIEGLECASLVMGTIIILSYMLFFM